MDTCKAVSREIGLATFINSSFDTKVISIQRLIRHACYSASTLVLVFYLLALGYSPADAGLFMTLTILGDVFVSSVFTLVADKIGRRRILAFNAIMMIVSGILWATIENYWALLITSVLGGISPSGKEIGRFAAVEESSISQLTSYIDRNSVLAWYLFVGAIGAALGSEATGLALQGLQTGKQWQPMQAYKLIFAAYAVAGVVNFMLCFVLSGECETAATSSGPVLQNNERRPLLRPKSTDELVTEPLENKSQVSAFMPNISWQAIRIISKLCLLFAVDSLAAGLCPATWFTYFFHQEFGFSEARLGTLFFVSGLLCSVSNLGGPALTKRVGLINTLVSPHFIGSITILLISFAKNPTIAVALFMLRASVNGLDQAPRQTLLSAVVLPTERTAAIGIVNAVKNLSQCLGPVITGHLAGKNNFRTAFVTAAILKLLYDGLLLGMFLGYRPAEEKAGESLEQEAPRERQDGRTDEHAVC